MATTMPINIPIPGEGAVASYNWTDIASGAGYVTFYAGNLLDNKILSTSTFYSKDIYSSKNGTTTAGFTKSIDFDWDILINKPLSVQGKAILNIPIYVAANSTTSHQFYIIAKIRKYSGSTETDLITKTSDTYTVDASGAEYFMVSLLLDIPLTNFKREDLLRLTIEGWSLGSAINAPPYKYHRIGNDPLGRTTDWDETGEVPSTLKALIPFKIDL